MDTPLRLSLASTLCLVPLLPLSSRLVQLQIMDHKSLDSRAAEEYVRSIEEVSPRADILDRNGKVLAQSLPFWSCFIDKKMVLDPRPMAFKLAPITGVPASDILKKYAEAKRFAQVADHLTFEQANLLRQSRLDGLGIVERHERFYPNGNLARGVLGTVSMEGAGSSGLELVLNHRLSGRQIRITTIKDGWGHFIPQSFASADGPPPPIHLTLDRDIQYDAEEILADYAAKKPIRGGMIAVQDPRTGQILAMASYPANPLNNPLVEDVYEPGSTFKIVTAAAALDQASVKERETFFCENGTYHLTPRVVIHDYEPKGNLTLGEILKYSSNIGISKVVSRMGATAFYRYARAFGFGNKTGMTLPGESAGLMKTPPELTTVSLAASSYGYGIAVTPLQVLNAYSAVANGGTLWQPYVILDNAEPEAIRRVAKPQTMAELSAMLEGVVQDGTGVQAKIDGYRLAGKTGTARRIDQTTHKYSTKDYNASFVGFFPVDAPRWTILVVIESPHGAFYGAEVAAPLYGELARRLIERAGLAPSSAVAPAIASISRPFIGRAAAPHSLEAR